MNSSSNLQSNKQNIDNQSSTFDKRNTINTNPDGKNNDYTKYFQNKGNSLQMAVDRNYTKKIDFLNKEPPLNKSVETKR